MPTAASWASDVRWFRSRLAADVKRAPDTHGCCPVAVQMYGRYAQNSYRCCTDRLHELRPLRPTSLPAAHQQQLMNASVAMVGDSLTEQLFISTLCLLWAEGGAFQLRQLQSAASCSYCPGVMWAATLTNSNTTLWFIRQHGTRMVEKASQRLVEAANVLFIGFGQNTLPSNRAALDTMLEEYDALRGHQRPARVLVGEEMAQHWPGGTYSPIGQYPGREICTAGDPVPNGTQRSADKLNTAIQGLAGRARFAAGFRVLALAALTSNRGDAHVGQVSDAVHIGPRGRDCLHWCIAPGITDALGGAMLHGLSSAATLI